MAEPRATSNTDRRETRAPLEAVVFDAGGTLVRLDFEWMAAAARQLGFVTDAAALRRGEIEGRRRYDQSCPSDDGDRPIGKTGDIHAYFGGTFAGAGCPPHLIGPLVVRLLAHEKANGLWARPMEGAREAIDGVAKLGLRRAVVSNSDGRAEWHLEKSGVREGLEFVVDSQIVGVEKPDPRIFAIALEKLGVAPERALYVGDIRSVDERGARAAGMHFVLIDPYGDYASDGVSSIRSVDELAAFVETRFEIPASRPEGRKEP